MIGTQRREFFRALHRDLDGVTWLDLIEKSLNPRFLGPIEPGTKLKRSWYWLHSPVSSGGQLSGRQTESSGVETNRIYSFRYTIDDIVNGLDPRTHCPPKIEPKYDEW